MLYSDRTPLTITELPGTRSNLQFFAAVAEQIEPELPAILLAGGADYASWTVRCQQGVVRFDRRPSDFSHAALICRWAKPPEQSWGVEIDPICVPASEQRPEHAGVTAFRCKDYADRSAWPNLAVIQVAGVSAEPIVSAAREPLREGLRYSLWPWLAAWRAFALAPEAGPHPLLTRVPHPGAALVALAYEAAEVTLVPAATDFQHCPELLWANAKHWGESVGEHGVRIWRCIRDGDARAPASQPRQVPVPE